MRPTLLIFLFAFLSHSLQACTCAITPACMKVSHASAIFIATVLEQGKTSNRYAVEEAFKGVDPGTKEMEIADDPYCGGGIGTGHRYLVFASSFNGILTTVGNCGGTVPIQFAGDILEFLRARAKGEHITKLYGTVGEKPDLNWPAFAWEPEHPLSGVEILAKVGEKEYRTTSGAFGHFRISLSEPGTYTATARLPNYHSFREAKGTVTADTCSDLGFLMEKRTQ